jgi:HTH-type transcriptional regulator/antitoxin HipB
MDIIHTAKDLGQLVRESRKAQGLSQDELAGLTGTGRRFIGDLESGKETAQLGKVLHVLNTLGISLSTIQKWKA